MCIAVPGRILNLTEDEAEVEVSGVTMRVAIHFVESPQIGDYILIHAGCAISKIEHNDIDEILELFKIIGVN